MFCYACFTAIKEIPRQWKFQKHKTVTVTEHNFCFHPQTAQTSFFTSNFRFLSSRSDLATVAVTSTLTSLIKTPGLDDWPREKEQSGLDGEGVPYQAPATPPGVPAPRTPPAPRCAPLAPTAPPSANQPATGAGEAKSQAPGDQGAGPRSSGNGHAEASAPTRQHPPADAPSQLRPRPTSPFTQPVGSAPPPHRPPHRPCAPTLSWF